METPTIEGAHPIPIVISEEQHMFSLDEEALEDILLQDHIKDCNAVVVSVAGAFRKGKSFLLDFFLRYMNYMYMSDKKPTGSWLGDENSPLDGFSWRGGSERDTTGILMWSEVFCTTLPNGEKVAVILLDTQGTFDSESTVRDCATVFALSTMLSSIQIYNLSQNIQEDDLQHLQLFTEYGRLALEDTGNKPFQKLQFLVRDWSFPYEANYGSDGGQEILDKRLKISDKQHPELQSLRKHIKSCFTDIECFLLPHPGLKVATNPKFDGRLADIEGEFKACLEQLVPLLLSPQNLVQKEIGGQRVKVKELVQYFKCYMNLFSGDDLPEPKSMLVATAEANNLSAVAAAKETYHQLMESVCGGPKPYLSSDQLELEHIRCREKALEQFRIKRKMGGDEFSESYRSKLEQDIDTDYNQFKAHNESKNIFKAARTPAVIVAIIILFYVLSGIFGLVGLYAVANIANLIMGVAILTLATWAYIRYSGEIRDIGEIIDHAATMVWEVVMKPVYQVFVEKSLQHAAKEATKIMIRQNSQINGKISS
ncbi:atlastin isoform X1 [Planococcus citri]|uniref:atlastin isoform X1 n=1 Tax=Planococcus citri TaxID=170843 RepID=UPI0031FA4149